MSFERLLNDWRAAERAGFLHLVSSLFFVQGLAYISQLVVALMLTPELFGIVRIIESILAIALVLGSLGAPSLAVKLPATYVDRAPPRAVLQKLLRLAAIGAAITATAAILLSRGYLGDPTWSYLASVGWVIIPMALTRTAIGYFQGVREIRRVSALNAALSVLGFAAILAGVYAGDVKGWLIGKYAGEMGFAIGLLWVLVRMPFGQRLDASVPRDAWFLKHGSVISISLCLRIALDNAPVLAAAAIGLSLAETGYLGIALVLLGGLIIIPAAAGNLLIPSFSNRLAKGTWRPTLLLNIAAKVFAGCALMALVVALILPVLIRNLAAAYIPAILALQLALLKLPLRAVATVSGGLLLAQDRNWVVAVVNGVLLVMSWPLYLVALRSLGVLGGVLVLVSTELLLMIAYLAAALRTVPRAMPVGTL